jgi:hypothetical protein
MAEGKVNVYGLGEKGVNLVKSPLHIDDNELRSAQNAEFYLVEGQGAIRKRSGLQKINSSVLAGEITGVIGVPLPAPGSRSVYAQLNASPYFRVTTNGTTWADAAGFQSVSGSAGFKASVMVPGRFFYLGDTPNIVMGYDGVQEFELARFGASDEAVVHCTHAGQVIVTVVDSSLVHRVFSIDPVTGEMTQVGDTSMSFQMGQCGVSYLGRVWIGGTDFNDSLAKIYSARVGTGVWTLERTAAAAQNAYVTLGVLNGKLYAGTRVDGAGTAAIVEERTAAGAWSTSRTGSTALVSNAYRMALVADGCLFIAYLAVGTIAIEKFTGSVWSVDKDLTAAGEDNCIGGTVTGSTVYYMSTDGVVDSTVWRRPTGGGWTAVDVRAAASNRGVMGAV